MFNSVVKNYDYELENGLEVLKLEENLYSSMGQNKEIDYEILNWISIYDYYFFLYIILAKFKICIFVRYQWYL